MSATLGNTHTQRHLDIAKAHHITWMLATIQRTCQLVLSYDGPSWDCSCTGKGNRRSVAIQSASSMVTNALFHPCIAARKSDMREPHFCIWDHFGLEVDNKDLVNHIYIIKFHLHRRPQIFVWDLRLWDHGLGSTSTRCMCRYGSDNPNNTMPITPGFKIRECVACRLATSCNQDS